MAQAIPAVHPGIEASVGSTKDTPLLWSGTRQASPGRDSPSQSVLTSVRVHRLTARQGCIAGMCQETCKPRRTTPGNTGHQHTPGLARDGAVLFSQGACNIRRFRETVDRVHPHAYHETTTRRLLGGPLSAPSALPVRILPMTDHHPAQRALRRQISTGSPEQLEEPA